MFRYLQPIPACAALVLVLGGTAFAADLSAPVYKGPAYKAPAASPHYNWSGFYLGGNVGYGWGKANTDVATGAADPFAGVDGADTIPPFAHSDSLKLNGLNYGGQIGYNWQVAPTWVLGIEADLQTARQKNSNRFTDAFSISDHQDGATTLDGTIVTDHEAKISWFGTVRGRLGYAFNDVLLYGTGGLAYGRVSLSGTSVAAQTTTTTGGGDSISSDAAIPATPGTPVTTVMATNFAGSAVNVGWTAGAGIEGALANNWTWKAEYLHVDLGSVSVTGTAPTGAAFKATSSNFTDDIVRVGLNYRFAPTAGVAPY
jgi:outer membrane immunogenic protein